MIVLLITIAITIIIVMIVVVVVVVEVVALAIIVLVINAGKVINKCLLSCFIDRKICPATVNLINYFIYSQYRINGKNYINVVEMKYANENAER